MPTTNRLLNIFALNLSDGSGRSHIRMAGDEIYERERRTERGRVNERTPAECCSAAWHGGGSCTASSAVRAPWMDSEWQCHAVLLTKAVCSATYICTLREQFHFRFVLFALRWHITRLYIQNTCITSVLAVWHFCCCTGVKFVKLLMSLLVVL